MRPLFLIMKDPCRDTPPGRSGQMSNSTITIVHDDEEIAESRLAGEMLCPR
jgi:hypothetical protein